MKVTQISTNSYGKSIAKAVPTAVYMGGVHTAEKNNVWHSGFEGFGVALTGSSCWNLMQMTAEQRHAFLESIYGKDGLGKYPKTKPYPQGVLIENEGQTVLVLVNPNTDKAQIQYNHEGTWYYFELMPETIATVIMEA